MIPWALLLAIVFVSPIAVALLQIQEFLYSLIRPEEIQVEDEDDTPVRRWRLVKEEFGFVVEAMT